MHAFPVAERQTRSKGISTGVPGVKSAAGSWTVLPPEGGSPPLTGKRRLRSSFSGPSARPPEQLSSAWMENPGPQPQLPSLLPLFSHIRQSRGEAGKDGSSRSLPGWPCHEPSGRAAKMLVISAKWYCNTLPGNLPLASTASSPRATAPIFAKALWSSTSRPNPRCKNQGYQPQKPSLPAFRQELRGLVTPTKWYCNTLTGVLPLASVVSLPGPRPRFLQKPF